ncbi:MAG: hypothetical protein PW786_09725 [Arachidicoccus sp.]|nr:hypothetical protein [Arachidicoccus sp.]
MTDNGIGLDNDNIKAFSEFDTDRKASIGGKGVGRLVSLKAFEKLDVKSYYKNDKGQLNLRTFEYKRSKEGFDNYQDNITADTRDTGTCIRLYKYESEYQKNAPTNIFEIAREILSHFQLYYIQNIEPSIILRNQNNIEVNLTNLFKIEFQSEILKKPFIVGENEFTIISKSHKAKSHKFHYCAHQRVVKEEGISKYIEDLRFQIRPSQNGEGFFYQVYILGKYLDDNVNEERTNFNFIVDDDEEGLDLKEISLAKIRREAIITVEELLKDFLQKTRKDKLESYYPIIESELPNYLGVVNYKKDEVEKLPVGLTKSELDLKLYEIESEWRVEVKKEGIELLDKKKDITSLEEYKSLYEKFVTEFNEIGQSDLARYIVHRRSVIDLLDKLIELNEAQKFENEDIIHSLFFPIRENKNTVIHDKQNLWLIDERLTFNSLLASDNLFKNIKELESSSSERMDIIIRQDEVFDNAVLYSEDNIPFESFTIIEFKRPERNDYKQGDRKKDPIKQVRTYVEEVINNKIKIKGKAIGANKSTPFYCYIVADITESLQDILDYESFEPTPDGLGYFKFYETKTSRAYIEVLPFKKVVKDAKKRNKILFDNESILLYLYMLDNLKSSLYLQQPTIILLNRNCFINFKRACRLEFINLRRNNRSR